MPTPQEQVDSLLYEAAAECNTRKCSVCRNKELRAAIAHFYMKKAADETVISFGWFYRKKLIPSFGGPALRTARDHVRMCLRVDTETGQPL